jgi:hypothetical protein
MPRSVPALGGKSRDLAAYSRRDGIRFDVERIKALANDIRDLSSAHAIPAAENS